MTSLRPREAVPLILVRFRTVSDRPRDACGRMSQPSLGRPRGRAPRPRRPLPAAERWCCDP